MTTIKVYDTVPFLPDDYAVALNSSLLTCRVLQRENWTLVAEARFFQVRTLQLLDALLSSSTQGTYCPYEQLFLALLPADSQNSEALQRIRKELKQVHIEKRMSKGLKSLHDTLHRTLESALMTQLGWHLIIHRFRGISLNVSKNTYSDLLSPVKHFFLTGCSEQHKYAYHRENRTLTLLALENAPAPNFPEVQLFFSEADALLQLLDWHPHYTPIELLEQSFAIKTDTQEQARYRVQRIISRLRRKLSPLPLSITSDSLGYTLHHVIQSRENLG